MNCSDDANLLILEENTNVARLIEKISNKMGYSSVVTKSLTEFYQALNDHKPNVIILDFSTLEKDSAQILQVIAECQSCAKVIISSAIGSVSLDTASKNASTHGVEVIGTLHKPFAADQLKLLLQNQSKPTFPNSEPLLTENN